MKATINGITLEGTPAEIAEYQRLTEPRYQIAQAKVKVDLPEKVQTADARNVSIKDIHAR